MRTMLAIVFTLFFSQMALANVDVNCFMNDCLTEGWHTFDNQTGQSTMVMCTEMDCMNNGWTTSVNDQEQTYSVCKAEGCFHGGWSDYDSRTGRLLSDNTCGRGFSGARCFDFGWNTYVPGRGSFQTRCNSGDCYNYGWVVRVPGFSPQQARCKTGGCFSSGWTLYR